MIKRQFYSLEHRSRDLEASSASSSSSSEHEAASSSDDEEALSAAHEGEGEGEKEQQDGSPAGPKFESSDDDKDVDEDNKCNFASGKWDSHNSENANHLEEISTKHHRKRKQESVESSLSNQWADLVAETLNGKTVDFADECVITCKKVLKCRLCPKTICLTSETMQAHLVSKKHARSLKQMKEGKLKVMLNSDGEEEEQGETHAERHARIVASFKWYWSNLENTSRKIPVRSSLVFAGGVHIYYSINMMLATVGNSAVWLLCLGCRKGKKKPRWLFRLLHSEMLQRRLQKENEPLADNDNVNVQRERHLMQKKVMLAIDKNMLQMVRGGALDKKTKLVRKESFRLEKL